MANIGQRIVSKALEILEDHPDGLRWMEMLRLVAASDNFNRNTVSGNLWDLDQKFPEKVYKPSRGLFRLVKFADTEPTPSTEPAAKEPTASKVKEEDFYPPFAQWLENDLQECTKAIPLGGNAFRDKWGTPDVIGKWESKRSDIVQAPTSIVSAEIKTDATQLITAFGQACAYRLFSHRTYLVVPEDSGQDQIDRLDSLCGVFGIGLVLFDSSNPADPGFSIRVRATRGEPDMFHLNRYLKLVEKQLFA